MNPQIPALHKLQSQDHRLTRLEHKLAAIPKRIEELDNDLERLEKMLKSEQGKTGDTEDFKKSQEQQLADEEEHIRQSKAKLNQVTNQREANAVQREIETTRRMVTARQEEIKKLEAATASARERIEAMGKAFEDLQAKAKAEKERLGTLSGKLEKDIGVLREQRSGLTAEIDRGTLNKYERIRKRYGGIAFVAAADQRCSACKMKVPHMTYVILRRGEEIENCENCGRLLYWRGHFPDEKPAGEQAPSVKTSAG